MTANFFVPHADPLLPIVMVTGSSTLLPLPFPSLWTPMHFSPGIIPSFFQSYPQSSLPFHLTIHSFLREGRFFVLGDRPQRCRLVFIVLYLLWKAQAPAGVHAPPLCTGAIGSHCLAPRTQASTEGCFTGCRHTRANQHVIITKNLYLF